MPTTESKADCRDIQGGGSSQRPLPVAGEGAGGLGRRGSEQGGGAAARSGAAAPSVGLWLRCASCGCSWSACGAQAVRQAIDRLLATALMVIA